MRPFALAMILVPRRLSLSPKQIEDGPVICGLCQAPFELPDETDAEEA
jgi:hypothetical protein